MGICAVGVTEELKMEVELNQRSALRSILFAVVIDRLADAVRNLWTTMSADDITICSESREQVEEHLEGKEGQLHQDRVSEYK